MHHRFVIAQSIAVLFLLTTAGVSAQTGNHQNRLPESHQMLQDAREDMRALKLSNRSHREQDYLTRMLDHHQSGIDMARMALKKSQNPALITEAKKIIAEQTKEISQMRRHLARPHRINRTAKPDPRMYPMMVKLRDSSASAFDSMFVDMMVAHHQGAIGISRAVRGKGVPHRTVSRIAARIIKSNQRSQKALQEARANSGGRTASAT